LYKNRKDTAIYITRNNTLNNTKTENKQNRKHTKEENKQAKNVKIQSQLIRK